MNLPVEIYEFFISEPNDLKWFCTNCEFEPTNGHLSQMNALDKKMKTFALNGNICSGSIPIICLLLKL